MRLQRLEEATVVDDELLDCGKPVNFTVYDDLIGNHHQLSNKAKLLSSQMSLHLSCKA